MFDLLDKENILTVAIVLVKMKFSSFYLYLAAVVTLLVPLTFAEYTYIERGWIGDYPLGCDAVAAQVCENQLLQCQLYTGPANDPATLCYCGNIFYAECLRLAGCQTAPEVGQLSQHLNYMAKCVDLLLVENCPVSMVTMCSINCASNTFIDTNNAKMLPVNNYGPYYLRIRICNHVVHPQLLARYGVINRMACSQPSDYITCSRMIPPLTFVPVALPKNTTYIEVDSCELTSSGAYNCFTSNPDPVKVYGNSVKFPSTFDVAQSNASVCVGNENCLGSFCDLRQNPHVCSPKTLKQIQNSGQYYMADPFGSVSPFGSTR